MQLPPPPSVWGGFCAESNYSKQFESRDSWKHNNASKWFPFITDPFITDYSKQTTFITSGVRGGEAASPPAWKNQGKLCFQGKLKFLKNPER